MSNHGRSWKNMWKILIFVVLTRISVALGVQVKVGAIFFGDEIYLNSLKATFKTYITRINQISYNDDFELVGRMRFATTEETSELQQLTCELIEEGAVAIFGPSSKTSSEIVASICHKYGIPHLLFDIKREESVVEKEQREMTMNFYPDIIKLSAMYSDIVQFFIHNQGWNGWTIVYDSIEGLNRLQSIVQLKAIGQNSVNVQKIENAEESQIFWKDAKISGERRIILDCSPDIIVDVIQKAHEFNMTGIENSFILTNLDSHIADIDSFKDYEATFHNIRISSDKNIEMPMPTHLLVLHDAVKLLSEVLIDFVRKHPRSLTPHRMNCKRTDRWNLGPVILKNMTNFRTDEDIFYTKNLIFGPYNDREHFKLELETRQGENKTSKEFDTLIGFEETRHDHKDWKINQESLLRKKHLIVATREGEPYVINKNKNGSNFLGNDKYEGYAIDLISLLAEQLEFTFTIEVVDDNQYGSWDPNTKQWNGIIGQLINKKADLGICDLTITPERREIVDFTVPFMSLGISILFFNQPPEPPDLFSFLQPFALEVWVYMATAYLILSILLFLMARISESEWENPHPCNQNPEELENQWTLTNTTWLTMGSIMGQGCDILPKSGTLRLVNGMWWFFALMMLNSYTANLAAFLTSSRIPSSIQNIEDLAGQTKIKFGSLRSGSTRIFFKDSNDSTFRQVFTKMEAATPSVYTSSNAEGLERVKKGKGKYAFLMETTSLQYLTERNCDVTQIGGQIGQKHYGIALPFGSPYRSQLSVQILRLSERGELFKLKEKWWLTEEKCPVFEQNDSNELGIEQLGGVFLVLGIGIFVAFVIGLFEFIWNVQQVAVEEKVTPVEAFKNESLFAMKFWITKKPIRHTSEDATSSESESSTPSENFSNEKAQTPGITS